MKILISGAKGALGQEMVDLLQNEGIEFLANDSEDLDVTDFKKTYKVLLDYCPDAICHFAALSDVDSCEKDQEMALRVNALSSLGLAVIAKKIGARLLYTSTNFVFDGNGKRAYGEGDRPNPINTYGKTKLLGENYIKDTWARHFIVRTSWVFGGHSKNFLSRFLNSEEKPAQIDAVSDRFACFTYAPDLVKALLLIIKSEKFGIYHVVNRGVGSFYNFLVRAQELMKFKTKIRPIKSDQLNLPAVRPEYSPLSSRNYELLSNRQMRTWEEALADFVDILSAQS